MSYRYAVCYFAEDGSEFTPGYHQTRREAINVARFDWDNRDPEIAGVFVFPVKDDVVEGVEINYGVDPFWQRGHC